MEASEANQETHQEDTSKKRPGCDHYARKCSFISPCCKKEYTCRVCHDDKENHAIVRQNVQMVKCLNCKLIQKVQRKCDVCHTVFGKYFCDVCRLFDDEEKGQFHCEACGLCRVGGRENFFHCKKCDMCLSIHIKNEHKCVVESSRRNCAVCLEDLHTSRMSAHIPPCGHLIHAECYRQCISSGNYACPTCNTSLVDMKSVWKHLDTEVANTPMPDEYKNFRVNVLCRDCHKESKVLFHVVGLKCAECGSYNTCRSADRDEEGPQPGATDGSADGDEEGPQTGATDGSADGDEEGPQTGATERSADGGAGGDNTEHIEGNN